MSSTMSSSPPTSVSDGSDISDLAVVAAGSPSPHGTDSDNSQAVGLANARLGQRGRRMLDLVNRLHATGVQVDIDLPLIAVVGNQSAGKSSLIESISGITLPRASGTCTRCPTECTLSNSGTQWQCTVYIRTMTDASGQLLGEPRNDRFGPVIYEKTKVEDRIRRAQRAILHPRLPMSQFLQGDSDDEVDDPNAPTFSTNCVSLKISGPDVADLSFCDLPGLIRSSGDGNTGDVELVEKLVESYIKKPSCIILLAVSCETDYQNQGALQLARRWDPNGERTVGVLTKPDRIPSGDELSWVRFLKNEVPGYTLNNNWYCVKQPGTTELRNGITWEQARANENNFFSMTPPWSLSSILSDLISKRLPEIYTELDVSMKKTRAELEKLPKAPSRDPRNEITTLLFDFTKDLSSHLEGVPDSDGLLQRIRPAQEDFRRNIRKSAPNFKPFEKKDGKSYRLRQFPFLENENEADDDGDADDENADGLQASTDTESEDYMPDKNAIYIDEVLKRAHEARTRELPGNYPHVVQEHYIKQFTKDWSEPAKMLCEFVHDLVSEIVFEMVHQHFKDFGLGLLERQIRLIMQEQLKSSLEVTMSYIVWLTGLEHRAFTLNTHYLSDYREKFLAHYKAARQHPEEKPASTLSDLKGFYKAARRHPDVKTTFDSKAVSPSEVLAGLVQMGYEGIQLSDLPKLRSDPMEPALIIMADVRAYFQVAYKRFADNVPLAIDAELVRGLERDIFNTLTSKLGIYSESEGSEICQELAQENPQVSDRREELTKKLERMQSASRELAKL
ncbi:hypothetical protein D9758_004674 [Tetrapyrgos nigripes]|uniref:P-loop containing nucleoside triphosphate hydrolase protein n=1 Tax=Tetrapyrgos nigripes TaxID=182062 RepID=A0A8H5H0A7_9AGAR|nr:hypothetical protein D9758_004674 [Tetrapyrgos nigripes]